MMQVCLALFLGVQAVLDGKGGYVYMPLLALQSLVGLLLGGLEGTTGILLWSRFVPGLLLLLAAFPGERRIGRGDGWLFLSLGIYLSVLQQLWLLFLATLLAGLWTIPSLFASSGEKKREVAFVPFVLAAYLGGWYYGWF